ncbi:MAG: divalent-cation tolerance protein CutA [Proteobacteria bacterium]|nr:divalent-cation tolerance protein CutA [Pseudomonadota bacterium]
MNGIIQIVTTIDDKEKAERIGKQLVQKRLASCVQIAGPIKSIYWWKGHIKEVEEWQCIIKSKKSHYKKIEEEIKRLHHYELPEIIAIDIDTALTGYVKWVEEETNPG